MNEDTKHALMLAIEHWERLRDGTQLRDEGPDAESCALCHRFDSGTGDPISEFISSFPYCVRVEAGEVVEECPVAIAAGEKVCENTPFYDARAALTYGYTTPDERYTACDVEVQFLKSLLPEEKEEDK